jgi:hypothetical protein
VRSPSACERTLVALIALAVLASPTAARGDDKQVCADAYGQTQVLRREGRLIAAREQAVLCTRDVCPEFIRTDCTTWLAQIDESQPTLVFDVRDASGAVRTDASVELDGRPWLASSDVKAHPIDPGKYTLRIALAGESPREEQIVVREGEKNRKVSVVFAPAQPPPAAAPAAPPAAPPADTGPPPQVAPAAPTAGGGPGAAPWIVGGAGVVLLGVGGALGLVVLGQKSTFDEHCDEATRTCDADGISARDTGETLGPLSTVAMVAGGVGIAVGAVWLAVGGSSDDGSATHVDAGASFTADGATCRVRGTF